MPGPGDEPEPGEAEAGAALPARPPHAKTGTGRTPHLFDDTHVVGVCVCKYSLDITQLAPKRAQATSKVR